jgi:hypothetical protein
LKFIKRLFYTICILIILGCVGILYCCFNPEVTEQLAGVINGSSKAAQQGTLTEDGSSTDSIPDGIADSLLNNSGDEELKQIVSVVYPEGSGDETAEYTTPDESSVSTPAEVSGRNGYVPINDVEEQIADTEAKSLEKQLSTGNLGTDLEFDSLTYPYYSMLNDKLKTIYRQIYANASSCTSSFAPTEEVSTSELKTAFEAFFNDHPEIFWIQTGYSCKHTQNGKCVEVTLKYYPIVNKLDSAKTEFEQQAQNIISGASAYGSDYDKEKYVHDALIQKVEYDENASMNQSAYSALVNGKTVCAGYARAFQYCMQKMGIPTYYCTGYSGEEHAWNIVKLADGYYNVDVTWDDTDPATYNYFNKTDADYSSTHVRKNLSVYLPACNGSVYAYSGSGTPDSVEIPEGAAVTEKPMEPLTWQGNTTVSSGDAVTASGVIDTLSAYYNNCYTQLVNLGSGDRQFTNVVTPVEWIVIEQEYLTGRYEDGYVKEALKKLGMDRFAIQLQAEKLSDGNYKLYHNVVTWKD